MPSILSVLSILFRELPAAAKTVGSALWGLRNGQSFLEDAFDCSLPKLAGRSWLTDQRCNLELFLWPSAKGDAEVTMRVLDRAEPRKPIWNEVSSKNGMCGRPFAQVHAHTTDSHKI